MKKYKIQKINSNPQFLELNIINFKYNKTKLFHSINDAKNYPLVLFLFQFPFIKTIKLNNNCLELECFNTITWSDIEDELIVQIQDYLDNENDIVIENNSKIVDVYAEITPNPNVMKFVLNSSIISQPLEIKNSSDTNDAPLAKELFSKFSYIKELFFDKNYISITKNETENWDEIFQDIRSFIKKYIENDFPIFTKEFKNEKKSDEVKEKQTTDFEKKIISLLDTHITPAVSADGGNIVFDSFEKETKTVNVLLQGACSGCPSSVITLKNGIETLLRDLTNGEIRTVNAINN